MLSDTIDIVCLPVKVRSALRFGFSTYVAKDDFILEKTQEQKGFIYDDCWWLSLNPFPNIMCVFMMKKCSVRRFKAHYDAEVCNDT